MIEIRTTVARLPEKLDRWRDRDGREVVVIDCRYRNVHWRFAGDPAVTVADLDEFVRSHDFIRRAGSAKS